MKNLFLFVFFSFSLSFLTAQTTFIYDASGNRTLRNTIVLSPYSAPSPANAPLKAKSVPEEDSLVFETPPTEYVDKLQESDVLIYPNPTKGALAVEIRNMDPNVAYRLEVFNMNGLTVFQQSRVSSYTPIDLSSKPKGMYVLRISAGDKFVTWKIIKE